MIATSSDARAEWLCPISRIRQSPGTGFCQAEACPLWRWKPLSVEGAFADAVSKRIKDRAAETGKPKVALHKPAVKWVMENREELGLPTEPTHGYCGLGGEVR